MKHPEGATEAPTHAALLIPALANRVYGIRIAKRSSSQISELKISYFVANVYSLLLSALLCSVENSLTCATWRLYSLPLCSRSPHNAQNFTTLIESLQAVESRTAGTAFEGGYNRILLLIKKEVNNNHDLWSS